MATDNKLLPIRAPEVIHKRLAKAALELTEKRRKEGESRQTSVSVLGVEAIRFYLDRLEAAGEISPYSDDDGAPDA